jgi:hypothetical protein
MDNQETFQIEWNLWLKWVIATSLGFFINDGIGYIVSTQFSNQICGLLDIIAAGIFIGWLQWLFVVRSHIPNSKQWVAYSAVGWAVGWIAGNLLGITTLVSLFVHGTILGFSQSWFFRRRLFSRSFIWILANAFGLPLSYGLSWYVIFPIVFRGYNGGLSGPADSIVRGILFGAITGITVLWLSRRPLDNKGTLFSNIQ